MKQPSQGRKLLALMRKKPLTYAEMMDALQWQSCSPWRRAVEALGPDEEIKKGKRWMGGKRYLVTWRCVKATKWTA